MNEFDREAHQFEDEALLFLGSDPNVEFPLQMARHEDPLLGVWSQMLQMFAEADASMFHELPIAQAAVELFDRPEGNIEDFEDLDPFVACRTTGLHLACRKGFHSLTRRLLSDPEKAFDCIDRQHRTPLHVAAAFDQAETVKALLHRGANPDS